jgi:small subunit ribosomal protein S10
MLGTTAARFHGPTAATPAALARLTRRQRVAGERVKEKIKIRLEAYDHRILDKAAQDIVDTAKRTGAKVAGPLPVPTRIERFTVQRSPHIDKKSREQFELRTHARVIEILEPTAKTNDVFSKVDVPAGVDIFIKQTVR